MRRILIVILSSIGFVCGFGWHLLDVIGRGDVLVKLPETLQHVQGFILEHQEIGYQIAPWFLMVISAVSLALLQWPSLLHFWRRSSVQVPAPHAHQIAQPPSDPEFISVREAATRLYESPAGIDGVRLSAAAEKLGSMNGAASPNERLDYLAHFISRKIAVYGCKSPARIVKKIDDVEVKQATFFDGATVLRDNFYDKSIYWVDLCVRSDDFAQLISSLIKTESNSSIPVQTSIERISLIDLFKAAEKYGLDFKGESHAILDLCKELRQSASDGLLEFWGRARRQGDPLLLIPKEHWYEYRIDWVGAFELAPPRREIKGFAKDNFFVISINENDPNRKAYFDIHLTKSHALQWLKDHAHKFINNS